MSNFYVTTSIPYVNGGHILATPWSSSWPTFWPGRPGSRAKKLSLASVPTSMAAKLPTKLPNSSYAKSSGRSNGPAFRRLGQELNISNDRFIRTTDPGHEQRSALIWNGLTKDIYKGKYVGWYCTGDEAFFTEAEVKANKAFAEPQQAVRKNRRRKLLL